MRKRSNPMRRWLRDHPEQHPVVIVMGIALALTAGVVAVKIIAG